MKRVLLLTIIIALLSILFIRRNTNNVCKTFEDYYSNRDNNENCYYNPDHELEVPDIVKRHGYPIEIHHALTEDGHTLTVFRIPYGKNGKANTSKPVFIQHGITLNAGLFLTTGKKALGFILADAGYDVWLGNFRGSRYSRNHTHLNTAESDFWNFSFHEHGIYDVRAQLDLVNEVTKRKVAYIGFSMGSTAAYVYSVTYPDLAQQRIEVFIALAPGVFMGNNTFLQYAYYVWTLIEYPLQMMTNGQLIPRPPIPTTLYKYICFPFPIQMKICQISDMVILGLDYEQNDPETLPVTLQYNIDSTSVKTFTHFAQLVHTGNFQQFDYGEEKNKQMYGSPKPPHYDLSRIKVPNYLIYAPNDKVVTKENTKLLYKTLPEKVKTDGIYEIKNENINHINIAVGKDVVTLIYDPIIVFLDKRLKF